jgi:hypothetical protein
MNNKERYLWIGVLILACLFCDRKMSQIETLESLDKHNQLNSQIQSDQINELSNLINQSNSVAHEKGFREGESHAMVTAINGGNLKDYKDGYHAALTQFTEPIESNKSLDSMFADMLIDFIDHELSAEESYWELLEYMTEDPSLKANTK